MSAARRFTSIVLASLCALAGGSLFLSAPALALNQHVFSGTFGEEGTGNGQFTKPDGVAVNDATHDVYVVDRGDNRVEEFTSTGAYIGQFNGSAAPTGAFEEPTTIAVDNSGNPLDPSAGDVYVVDAAHNVIDKFSAAGVYEGQITAGEGGSPFSGMGGVAVDPSGVVWVTAEGPTGKMRWIASATRSSTRSSRRRTTIESTLRQGLAADAEGRLYIAGYGGVRRYKNDKFEEEFAHYEER